MRLTREEIRALRLYLDETSVNITRLTSKTDITNVKAFETVITKIYKEDDRNAKYNYGTKAY